jgi:hypothetical protein
VCGTGTPQVPLMSYIWAWKSSYSCRERKEDGADVE